MHTLYSISLYISLSLYIYIYIYICMPTMVDLDPLAARRRDAGAAGDVAGLHKYVYIYIYIYMYR